MEFNRAKSQTLSSYLREFIFPFSGQTFQVKKVIPPEVGSVHWERNLTEPFITEELEKLSSPNFNRAFPHYKLNFLNKGKTFFSIEPDRIEAELYPNTFACKTCRKLQTIGKRDRDNIRWRPRCKDRNCNGSLSQFTIVLVCRNCGELRNVPTACPECKNDLRYKTRARGAIEVECSNESCKINSSLRKFDFIINVRNGCKPECNNSSSWRRGVQGPLIQKPSTAKIFRTFVGKILQFKENEEIRLSLSEEEIKNFGFEIIKPGNLTIYQFALGYKRVAKFEDFTLRKRSEDYVYPFVADGKLVVYGNAITTAGVEFKLDNSILSKTIDEFLSDESNKKRVGFSYMFDIVNKEWNFHNRQFDIEQVETETAQRLLLHTLKHTFLVVAPIFCGLDYGELGGFYKSEGMCSRGLSQTNSPCVYIYDNTKYGSGVTFSLISNQIFKQWLNKSIEMIRCPRNRCVRGACKACIFLPHTTCFIDINRGLDRELTLAYLTEASKQFLNI